MNKKIIAIALAAGAVTIGTGVAIAADGPAITTKSGTLGQPAAGMGQVVFFRPGSIMGAALGCTVHEDDKEIARLGSGNITSSARRPASISISPRVRRPTS